MRLGPERGYDVPDLDTGVGSTLERFAAAANRVTGAKSYLNPSSTIAASPGFVVVRVPRRRAGGASVDRHEARRTLANKPWFAELRHLGSDARYHLFERPDVAAAAAERRRAGEIDVAAGLAELARGGR